MRHGCADLLDAAWGLGSVRVCYVFHVGLSRWRLFRFRSVRTASSSCPLLGWLLLWFLGAAWPVLSSLCNAVACWLWLD